MSWRDAHSRSEQLAARAELEMARGFVTDARKLYFEAAVAEEEALRFLDASKPQTFGITAVSAGSLYSKANEYQRSEAVAFSALASSYLPEFAQIQLRTLLQEIWNQRERAQAGLEFLDEQVLVAVSGGKIVRGGAPLDLVVEKAQVVQSLFYRSVELILQRPFRKRGAPPADIRETCTPWLFQATPGSYQFSVAVQTSEQRTFFDDEKSEPREIVAKFFSILKAIETDPEADLPEIVQNDEYASVFLKLARELTPSGDTYTALSITRANNDCVTLTSANRIQINHLVAKQRFETEGGDEIVEFKGTLRAVNLNDDWLKIMSNDREIIVRGAGDTIDDVIGPLVNKSVVVKAARTRGSKKWQFVDVWRNE